MKILKKMATALLISIFIIGCSSNDESSNCESCSYTVAAGETAGTVPAAIIGQFNLVLGSSQAGYAVKDGTKATFTISEKEMLVEIEGEECITLKNPIVSANQVEYTFKDTCRDKVTYSVSSSSSGGVNEINVVSTSGSFYGQFQ